MRVFHEWCAILTLVYPVIHFASLALTRLCGHRFCSGGGSNTETAILAYTFVNSAPRNRI